MAALRNGLDSDDSGVEAVGIGELGDKLLGYGRVFGKGVFKFESVVLVLLDGEGNVDQVIVDVVHERNEVGVPYTKPVRDDAKVSMELYALGCCVVGDVVAVGVDVGGGAVFNVSFFGVALDFSGVGGQVVLSIHAFK